MSLDYLQTLARQLRRDGMGIKKSTTLPNPNERAIELRCKGLEAMRTVDLSRSRVDLILTELDLVRTFLRISVTSPDLRTRDRNRTYALEAYAMARRYWSQLVAPAEVIRVIQERFLEAREELEAAGEVVYC